MQNTVEIDTILASFSMWANVLPTFGRGTNGEVALIWKKVMDSAQVTDQEFRFSADIVLQTETEFPAPATVIKIVRKRRESLGWALHGETAAEMEARRFGDRLALPEPSDEHMEQLRAKYQHLRSDAPARPAARQERVGFRQPTTDELEAAERKRQDLRSQLADGMRS